MKVTIELPKEFEEHFNIDRFKDSLERVRVDIQCSLVCSEVKMSSFYELELIRMLREAMLKAKVVKERTRTEEIGEYINNENPDVIRLYWTKNKETGKYVDPFRFKKNCELKVKQLNKEAGYEKYELTYEYVNVNNFPEWSWYWSYKTEKIEYNAIFKFIPPKDN